VNRGSDSATAMLLDTVFSGIDIGETGLLTILIIAS
jgi:hypothetical protein